MSNEIGWETQEFQRHRRHLEKVAYRMLGSVSEAEDALQEAWLRLGRSRQDTINNPRAWLTTIVGRVCVDMLRARRARRRRLCRSQRELVDAFLAAARAGDFDALVAALDPNVVFRARGDREIQLERTGAADVASTWATFGPRLAVLCAPALVNGQEGLLIEAGETRLGAVGFNIVSGLIATIDLTLDPTKLEELTRAGGPLNVAPAPSGEAVSLSHLRGSDGGGAQRIIAEALRWPGVERTAGHLGSVALLLDKRELGHLHGDIVADVPLPPGPAFGQIEDAASIEQREAASRDWVSVPLDSEQGLQKALALLRDNYEQATRPSVPDDRSDP